MHNRDHFTQAYPWLVPHAEPETLIIGDDLDAALSAALYLHTHPRAQLVGLYRGYERIVCAADIPWEQALGAVWLDLDIYDARCRSLGHHIVRLAAGDRLPGFASSCNLNEHYGRSVTQNFRQKYPLGTVHFLMWLYGVEIPARRDADLLLWLADSTYINGQTGRFRENVGAWLRGYFPLPSLLQTFAAIDTLPFEERMRDFQARLSTQGFVPGAGQARSRHLGLSGFQCQPVPEENPVLAMRKLLIYIANITGWRFNLRQIEAFRPPLQERVGTRRRLAVAALPSGGLDAFLARAQVFSYVFTHRDKLNYTTFGGKSALT